MSQLEVDKIIPQSGTTLTLGDSGDTINFGSGVLPNFENLTVTGDLTVDTNSLYVDSANNRVGIGTASPQSELVVRGSTPQITLEPTADTQSTRLQFCTTDGTIQSTIQSGGVLGSAFKFVQSSSEVMRIDSSGKVGIGTSSPATTLEVNGDISIARTAGGYTFREVVGGSERAGIKSNASNELLFNTGGASEAVRIDANGKVGIGQNDPTEILEVSTTNPTILIKGEAAGNVPQVAFGRDSATSYLFENVNGIFNLQTYIDPNIGTLTNLYQFNANSHRWYISGSEAMRINSSGNVGIGESNPTEALHISSTASDKPIIILENNEAGTGDARFYFKHLSGSPADNDGLGQIRFIGKNDASEEIIFGRMLGFSSDVSDGTEDGEIRFLTQSGGSEATTLSLKSGNVGIGTTNPIYALDISSDNPVLRITDSDDATRRASLSLETAGGPWVIENNNNLSIRYSNPGVAATSGSFITLGRITSPLIFGTNATEAMRIDSSRNLLLGKTSSGAGNRGVEFTNLSSANPRQTITSTGTGAETKIEFRNGNGYVGEIFTNGSGTTYLTSSDYRLKENVVDLDDATTRVKQLQPKRFNFIADADTTVDGFLAHEVSDIVPEAIKGTKDEVDAEGNPVYQGIDQSKLVPLLVASLKEALTEIDNLKARVDTLEGN